MVNQEHLREVTCGIQQDGDLHKRWFSCQFADLYTWHDDKYLLLFEFCYNKQNMEHSLRWHHANGFSYARVDDGTRAGITANKGSPILVAEKNIDSDYIYVQFKNLSDKIDFEIRVFIMRKLLGIVVDY